jgi:D-glycero-D-manno-heptose 1,7-bisphosphate phosphatase
MKQKALFLDRDGVINHDPGDYTMSISEFIILPTVMEALKLANDKGYSIFVVTNQGGIAKGLYGHDTVAATLVKSMVLKSNESSTRLTTPNSEIH